MPTVRYTTVNGEVIAEKRNGARRLYTPDPLGSTVALLDNTQTQVDTFTYWPYGEVRTSTGTTPPPFQFVGTQGYYSDGVGRTYVRARYLHTQKGRWLTQDPLHYPAGDANVYRYAFANPIVLNDPSGLYCQVSSAHCDQGDVGRCWGHCRLASKVLHDCVRGENFHLICNCCTVFKFTWGTGRKRGTRDCGEQGKSFCGQVCDEKGYSGSNSYCQVNTGAHGQQILTCLCCTEEDI
jgi:RHS repeat-associated protein